MLRKFNDFNNQIFESGIRDIKNIVKRYPSKECELYIHIDLDGVTSGIAMKEYLKQYGIKTMDVHGIQYGSREFAIENTKEGRMPVLVDFAHSKPMFTIATDHHDRQAGAEETDATYYKPARSNVETISGEISPTEIFTQEDIKLISTVDSANFLENNITPEMVSNSIFKLDHTLSGKKNRFIMGLVVNRLLLAYKNKKISGTSLDGEREYKDKNFLECLTLDASASLISMFNNIQHYIKTFDHLKWDRKSFKLVTAPLDTPDVLQKNLDEYQARMKDYDKLVIFDEYKIGMQYGGGEMFDTGSYDRYTVFKNNPDLNFFGIIWPMGLIQVSCNPFKEKALKGVNLAEYADEVLEKYRPHLEKSYVDLYSVKKVNESEVEKNLKRGTQLEDVVGFKFSDLKAFYKGKVKYYDKTKGIVTYDLDEDKFNLKVVYDKKRLKLTKEESFKLKIIKISVYDLIRENSGGHKCITNLSSWNYLDYVSPKIKQYLKGIFKVEPFKSTRVMQRVLLEILDILKAKIKDKEIVKENLNLMNFDNFKLYLESKSNVTDIFDFKIGDKLLITNTDNNKKEEVEILSQCKLVENDKDIDCKVKVKTESGEEKWAYHKESDDIWFRSEKPQRIDEIFFKRFKDSIKTNDSEIFTNVIQNIDQIENFRLSIMGDFEFILNNEEYIFDPIDFSLTKIEESEEKEYKNRKLGKKLEKILTDKYSKNKKVN